MPFFEGKKVSINEWRRLRGDTDKPTWKQAFGYADSDEVPRNDGAPTTVDAEVPSKPKRRNKRTAQAQAAAAAITGLDITLPGDEEE